MSGSDAEPEELSPRPHTTAQRLPGPRHELDHPGTAPGPASQLCGRGRSAQPLCALCSVVTAKSASPGFQGDRSPWSSSAQSGEQCTVYTMEQRLLLEVAHGAALVGGAALLPRPSCGDLARRGPVTMHAHQPAASATLRANQNTLKCQIGSNGLALG